MEPRSLLQIVSGFKPRVDGMGDFSRRLGTALWNQNSIRSHFLVYRQPPTPFDTDEILPNTLSYASQPTPAAFHAQLADLRSDLRRNQHFDSVLLHYGPYAYSSDGKPAAFVREIEELARTTRLLVFFHEVHSSGFPWQRARWTRPEQQASVRALLAAASVAFTSNPLYLQKAQALNPLGREILQIPIFSNIGEPAALRPLHQRTRQLVVFGQLVTRVRLFKDCLGTFEEICRKLRIEKIVDVGSGQSPHIPQQVAGVPVVSAGWMEEQQLSNLMADSVAGIVGYWPDVWQKSGVIAAYQAHGLVPIMVEVEKRAFPRPAFLPYISPEQIAALAPDGAAASDAEIQAIADAGHEAYLRHQSVNRCAEVIAGLAFPTASARQG